MEPSEGPHPDPVSQASQAAGQKLAELAALAALAGQVYGQIKAGQAGRAASEAADGEAGRGAAQAGWAPALHREWLADAGLLDVARAWGAAVPWEHTDPGAATALAVCEERLRELHPYAMRRFDQLRGQGQDRVGAMMATVPLFAMHPSPRPAPQDASQGLYMHLAAGQVPGSPAPNPDAALIMRILDIIARLSERSIAEGRGPLTPDVAEMELKRLTNAPESLISQVIAGLRNGTRVMPPPAARRTAATAGPGAANWPGGVHDAVSASGRRPGQQPGRPARPAAATSPAAANWPGDVRDAVAAGPSGRPAARPARRPQTPGQRRGLRP